MHFWIDKRSSPLYNFGSGGGRRPGAGGFYSRSYGTRHLPPRSSSNNSSSHYQMRAETSAPPPDVIIRSNNMGSGGGLSGGGPSGGIGGPFQIPFTSRFRSQGNNQLSSQASGGGGSSFRYPVNIGDPVLQQNGDYRNHLGGPVPSGINNRGGINAGMMGPPLRRPRSQGQGPFQPGRRRSSGSGNNPAPPTANNQQRRTSMYRWTYDPNHHLYPRPPPTDQQQHHLHNNHNHHHHNHQAQVWNEINDVGNHPQHPRGQNPAIPAPNPDLSTPINHADLTSGVAAGTTATTSTQSVSDPAWRRTKRIGLTLCFMAFILLSTVAAKFVIEGPWLIDKTPRSERTEATIYFFLTELIFVAFAMALFFTGVTCLRKRTNAYLLRQFNQYILQTSPHSGPLGSPDYFRNHPNGPPSGGGGSGATGGGHLNPQGDRPYAYLPSLETNLLMEQSSNLVIGSNGGGCSKPPPYHIALYLPVPDDCSFGSKDHDCGDFDGHSHHTSPWISSSSCGVVEGRGERGAMGDIVDKTEDSDEEIDEGIPRRKRQKKEEGRSETPPPPYGQI